MEFIKIYIHKLIDAINSVKLPNRIFISNSKKRLAVKSW